MPTIGPSLMHSSWNHAMQIQQRVMLSLWLLPYLHPKIQCEILLFSAGKSTNKGEFTSEIFLDLPFLHFNFLLFEIGVLGTLTIRGLLRFNGLLGVAFCVLSPLVRSASNRSHLLCRHLHANHNLVSSSSNGM